MSRFRAEAIFDKMEAVITNCKDVQNTINTARNTFPADESFVRVLDDLQAELDTKAKILDDALRELAGIE